MCRRPQRRPWKLAAEAATVDRLSGGCAPFRRTSRDPFAALEPDDVRELRRLRPDAGWEIVLEGSSNPDDPVSMTRVAALRDAGASWWIESPWNLPGGIEAARARGRQGPPPI